MFSKIRELFPTLSKVIYLDNAATTPTPIPVYEKMVEYFEDYCANIGRGVYKIASKATIEYEETRKAILNFIGADSGYVVFTKNTTEAINIAANGLKLKNCEVITTKLEHNSNIVPWLKLKNRGVTVKFLDYNEEYVIDPDTLNEAITERTRVFTVTHVSNVVGSENPVKELFKVAHDNNIIAMVDCAQSLGHIDVDVKDIAADIVVFPGHKGLLGPQGTGGLYVKENITVEPLIVGGGTVKDVRVNGFVFTEDESRFEGGTPNIPGIIGLKEGIGILNKVGIKRIEEKNKKLGGYLYKTLRELEFLRIYGKKNSGIVPFSFEGMNPYDVAVLLDEIGSICVRAGHHCAMILVNSLDSNGVVRVSTNFYNTKEEIKTLRDTLIEMH